MNRTFYIAGVQFRPREQTLKGMRAIKEGNHLDLIPEPENKFDPNAVKIEYNFETPDGIESIHLGYVPKKFSSEVAGLLSIGVDIECIVQVINPEASPWEMCRVTIRNVEDY